MRMLQMKCFLSVVKTGKYADTANELGITQSALSKQIRKLEEKFSVKLFKKSTYGIELTKAGKAFYPYAQYMVQQFDNVQIDLQQYILAQPMRIRITSMYFLNQYNILELIHPFSKKYYNIGVMIDEAEALVLQNLLDKQKTDAIIIYSELLQKKYERVIPLREDRLVAVMNRKHPLAKMELISLKQLENETFILMRGDSLMVSGQYRHVNKKCGIRLLIWVYQF